jgi:hypothetical protein
MAYHAERTGQITVEGDARSSLAVHEVADDGRPL